MTLSPPLTLLGKRTTPGDVEMRVTLDVEVGHCDVNALCEHARVVAHHDVGRRQDQVRVEVVRR